MIQDLISNWCIGFGLYFIFIAGACSEDYKRTDNREMLGATFLGIICGLLLLIAGVLLS